VTQNLSKSSFRSLKSWWQNTFRTSQWTNLPQVLFVDSSSVLTHRQTDNKIQCKKRARI